MVTASLFGEGSATVIFALLGAAVVIAGAAIMIKKKKGVVRNDVDEDEE